MNELLTLISAITANMSDGLVVLDAENKILTLNLSAQKLFSKDAEGCIGRSPSILNNTPEFKHILEEASQGRHIDSRLTINSRACRVIISPIAAPDGATGAVMLILDVTQTDRAEQSRREFSANVSHELRTPLTSISGYAEIMKTGLARPEDMAEFAGRISDEASRLIDLIDDIMKLSRLDESIDIPDAEPVELLALSQEVCARLSGKAADSGISLRADGSSAVVRGNRRILDEMIYNLCENAIKYNKPGGSVLVTVAKEAGSVTLCVSDTGIGIPKEHQDKVFERFYRVDKSHSRASGGTGLGLSIVKHGASVMGAKLELNSTEGEGTTVNLVFAS